MLNHVYSQYQPLRAEYRAVSSCMLSDYKNDRVLVCNRKSQREPEGSLLAGDVGSSRPPKPISHVGRPDEDHLGSQLP